MTYSEKEQLRQANLRIVRPALFSSSKGDGYILQDGRNNIYPPIRQKALDYFNENGISWWNNNRNEHDNIPTGSMLSSQVACVNHLFPLIEDESAVLRILNGLPIDIVFTRVYPFPTDVNPRLVSFEVIGQCNWLKERGFQRGKYCTSVDACIYAGDIEGKNWIIPIEWKYTEGPYNRIDKSHEDRPNEIVGENGRGKARVNTYGTFISQSASLIHLEDYYGSIYFFEPFYELMRQSLWAEQIVSNKETDVFHADHFLHINVIPNENDGLRKVVFKGYEGSPLVEKWASMHQIDDNSYLAIAPNELFSPLLGENKYSDLIDYLSARYW